MKLLFEDKLLSNEEATKLAKRERERLKIPTSKPLPQGFQQAYLYRLGKVYVDENIVSACMGLNFICTLKNCLKKFKSGEYGEILEEDKYNNLESRFFGNNDGVFACYKTYNWYLRIDMFEMEINGKNEIITYASLHKTKANQRELNEVLKKYVQKELTIKDRQM